MVFKLIVMAWIFKSFLAKEFQDQTNKDIMERISQNIPLDLDEKYPNLEMDDQDYFLLNKDWNVRDRTMKRSYFMCLFIHCPVDMQLKLIQMYNSEQKPDSNYKHLQTKRNYFLGKKKEKNFRDFISMRY
ncbi:hypothetical protein BpHYR1_017218 [Brachionus plicatilis]|uniref:Uncharacterized protein n=1 Tax=Brachionus plicatilis TaxID=10195 RepID=A0A3M7QRD3_BRAPC|nr:hypothetical protein BpHYR1_017218 [Brachionus plicatilis]